MEPFACQTRSQSHGHSSGWPVCWTRRRAEATERDTNTEKRACSRFMTCLLSKLKKKNLKKNQYWIGFEGANSDNTSMTLMSAQCFSVICLLDVRCICMESDLCWLCVTVLAVVWEVLCHKAFRKVIQWKNTGRIHIWLSWMNGILHSGTANCFQVFQICISAAVWLRSGNDSWNGFRSRSWFGLKWEVDYLFCSGGINYVC